MEPHVFELIAGGRPVRYLLRHPGAEDFFTEPLRSVEGAYDLALDPERMERGRALFPPDATDAWLEYKLLLLPTAQFLMRSRACVMHGVALAWRGRAWLFCAPSGTGKTTQFIRWKQLLGDEIRLINGDQPVVTLDPDGEVRIWASPWTGKERWVGLPGPVALGGVVFLEQAAHNEIRRLAPGDCVNRLFETFSGYPETESDVRALAELADAMLMRPAWLLRNRGDLDSARMTIQAIDACLTEGRTL